MTCGHCGTSEIIGHLCPDCEQRALTGESPSAPPLGSATRLREVRIAHAVPPGLTEHRRKDYLQSLQETLRVAFPYSRVMVVIVPHEGPIEFTTWDGAVSDEDRRYVEDAFHSAQHTAFAWARTVVEKS